MKGDRGQAWARRAAGPLAVVGIAWFFGGLTGVFAAVAGLAIAVRFGPRWVAGAGFGALVIAGIATVVEVTPTSSYGPSFATDRPIANDAALVAGVLVFVAVVAFAVRERRSTGAGQAADRERPPGD